MLLILTTQESRTADGSLAVVHLASKKLFVGSFNKPDERPEPKRPNPSRLYHPRRSESLHLRRNEIFR